MADSRGPAGGQGQGVPMAQKADGVVLLPGQCPWPYGRWLGKPAHMVSVNRFGSDY